MSFMGIDLVNFEYRSVMTTLKRLPDLVLGSRPRILISSNSNGLLAAKRRRYFCDFVTAPLVLAHD